MNSPLHSSLRRLGLVLAWLALTVAFYQPPLQALDGGLDPSIFAAYAYYTAHQFQFGPDLVAMAGPYGFVMYGQFYGGDLFWLRQILDLAVSGLLAGLTLWFFCSLPRTSLIRWLWFPAQVILTTRVADLGVSWTMLLAAWCILADSGSRRTRPLLLCFALGFFALGKGTHLMLSAATVGVLALTVGRERGIRHALLLATTYLVSVIGLWTLAGQNPLHLPSYLRGSWHLASAYNEAMSVEEPREIFRQGVTCVLLLAAALIATAWWRRRDLPALGWLALLAGNVFVMWKHGFVRADTHTIIFFCFVGVAVLAWYLRFFSDDRGARARPAGLAVLVLITASALAAPAHPQRPPVAELAAQAWAAFQHRVSFLLHLNARHRDYETRLDAERARQQLPHVQELVGRASIDFFGVEQGLVILNRLNYRPRPMGGGAFNVYSEYLMQLNRNFLRDPTRRPDFYLMKPATIDRRLAAQDDGLALLDILHTYRPEALDQGTLLMRVDPTATMPAPRPLSRHRFNFGEPVTIPPVDDDQLVLARFDVRSNLWGRLAAILYKAPPVEIELSGNKENTPSHRRLVPVMARSPFILSPSIEDVREVLGLYASTQEQSYSSFTLSTPDTAAFQPVLQVEFFAVRRPPPLDAYHRDGLLAQLEFPFANAIPESITPPFRTHPLVRYLHAPSEIAWVLDGRQREFAFHYGIDAEAYERGTTNGVDFIVELRGPSGGVHPIFQRRLQPRAAQEDRGAQVATLPLPPYAAGSRLILRTGPGEHGDNAWDWAYASRMELRQGHFTAAQFPGFSRAPSSAEAENAAPIELEGNAGYLLHVPGVVRFDLHGDEKRLSLRFGFLPGAYTDGGATAGADYIVELQPATAGPGRELFRRTLRPVELATDRGPQSAEVALPAINRGDRLIVRTAPVPGGTASWGWTYFSRLVIE